MKDKTKCVYCGKPIDKHDKYCKYCGMQNYYFNKEETLKLATEGKIDYPKDLHKFQGRLLGLFLGLLGVLITIKLYPKEDKTYKEAVTFSLISTSILLVILIIAFFVILHLQNII